MNHRILFILLPTALFFGACTEKQASNKEAPAEWHPQNASVAKHITTVHGFKISEEEGSHLHVTKTDGKIVATFREDALATLGGEKALFVFGMNENASAISKSEYLYFLEALHAFLVMNAPKWDGGENKDRKSITATEVKDEPQAPAKKERPRTLVEITSGN